MIKQNRIASAWVKSGMALVLALTAMGALAQLQKPDDAIRYRKAVFEVISFHFGAINQALTKGPLVQKDVEQDAALVHQLATLPWHAFLPGSINAQSRAKPEIFSQADRFKKMADEFTVRTATLESAAKGGDKTALKIAFEETARSCKDCHDQFRTR